MDINTFSLFSNEVGGIFTQRQIARACGGDNISPQLSWINAPRDARSFAITMFDLSVPNGYGFWHWVVFNIPSKFQTIASGAGDPSKNILPLSCIQVRNDYGDYGYGGPCPPENTGFHLYLITVYALNTEKLPYTKDSLSNALAFEFWRHTIEKASIVVYYKR